MQDRIVNPYGYFDTLNHEYVITNPSTPTPWINYIGQGQYGGIISNTAGGYSFDRDPRNRRVSRYRYNSIPSDQPGRYIYIRDQESGEYWSPTKQPTPQRDIHNFECRHGAGYTRIHSSYRGISVNILYFVPPGQSCELWVINIKNIGHTRQYLRTFSYVEFSYFDALIDLHNLDWGAHIFHSEVDHGIIKAQTQFRPTTSYFASSQEIYGFDTDREVFLGRDRDLSAPIVVVDGEPRRSLAALGNNIGSLCHEWFLEPGEEKSITYILGITEEASEITKTVMHFQIPENVELAFYALCEEWESILSKFKVDTPDDEMNAMLNFWNVVQCRTTLFWSRFVSAYETGLGRGMGTRDSAQDTLAMVHAEPTKVRETLNMLWHLQFLDGHTLHQVYPLTGEGGVGLASEFPDWPQWFSDDHLWLVLAECAYIRETGDVSCLDTHIPFWDGDETDTSIWSHILKAVNFTLEHRGPHGLPRSGFFDWDDTLNIDQGSGKAESVWCGQFFCRVMLDLVELCNYLGKNSDAQYFISLHQEMAEIIHRVGWDGNWFARAFDNNGIAIGVHTAEFQQIALNTQTWAVIGEIGNPSRLEEAMQQAHNRLNTEFGLALMLPGYRRYLPAVQGTSTYPPGAKENAGIFSHANTWAIIAAAKLGWSDKAYLYYRQLMPFSRLDADIYAAEPYVYCNNICGPEHPKFGLGRNAWLTGTAAWMYVAATQYILGIQPTYLGLRIAPTILDSWKNFSVQRVFRGVTYNIDIIRIGPGGEVSLSIDGENIEGNIIPLNMIQSDTANVTVHLGINNSMKG